MSGDYEALDHRITRLERELSAAHAEIRVLRLRRAVPRLFYAALAAADRGLELQLLRAGSRGEGEGALHGGG